jgi:signal transduction histidine kinase
VRWQGRLHGDSFAKPRWVELAGTPCPEPDGSVLWQGVIMDITPQKMAEEALTRSREDLRALTVHLEKAKEEERKAIAREIHDEIGAIIASLKFDVAWLRSRPSMQPEQLERLAGTEALLESARQASDRIARNLRPSVLDQGIVAALEWLTREFGKRYSIATRFRSNREQVDLDEARRTAMFRIGQEALTNIAKHAGGSRVTVELFCSNNAVTLEIVDNGSGMRPGALAKDGRFGVRGMRERATSLGGWLELSSIPQQGTAVMLSLPWNGAKR